MATTTVTATYLHPSGSPCRGRVSFQLVSKAYQEDTPAIYPTVIQSAILGDDGEISVELEPTSGDDAAFDTDDLTYQVTERINGSQPSTYWVDVPTSPSVDLGTLTTYEVEPGFVRELVVPDLSTLGVAMSDESEPVFRPEAYGAQRNGTSDDTAAVQAALDAAYTSGGGVVYLSEGTYRLDSTLTLLDDANATKPLTVPITIRGVGPQWTGRNSVTTSGGSVLDIRGSDTYGKLKTKGTGHLTITGVTFMDSAGGTTPFLYTTNTSLDITRCAFIGSKDTVACDQDAIICGGTVPPEGGDYTSGFQGYATTIQGNYFNHIRRAVYGRTYFNGNVIRGNTIWAQCGNATGGAIEINGSAVSGSDYAVGNVIEGNLIELVGYDYGIDLEWALDNVVAHNSFYDDAANTLNSIRLRANTLGNTVISGHDEVGVSDLGTRNTLVTTLQGEYNQLGPTEFTDVDYYTTIRKPLFDGVATYPIIQPYTARSDASAAFGISRAADEGSNPGASVYEIRQRGDQVIRGAQAGNVTYQDAAGTDYTVWSSSGRAWRASGVGGNMSIHSGTGGSNIDLTGVRIRLIDHTGQRFIQLAYASIPDASLVAGEVGLWFDASNGAAKLEIKGKTLNGTVVAGEIALT